MYLPRGIIVRNIEIREIQQSKYRQIHTRDPLSPAVQPKPSQILRSIKKTFSTLYFIGRYVDNS